jgi:hypothetical protein
MCHIDVSERKSDVMRIIFLTLFVLFIKSELIAQTNVSVPGEYYQLLKSFPLSNEAISFTLPGPFTEPEYYIPDENYTYQYLTSFPLVSDSLLSECIKYALLSLSLDLFIKKKGTEIWYGLTSNKSNLDPTVSGVYYKNFMDSTRVYVLTAFSLSFIEKKKKTNTSKYIGESIKFILDKYSKHKQL